MLEVVERFVSINGEGAHAGELAAFIRFCGCNLCCSYCDASWANQSDAPVTLMTVRELTEWIRHTNLRNVTLTGGEPLLQTELPALIEALHGFRVEIETNGSVPLTDLAESKTRPVFTVDYKLPGSGMESKMLPENFACLYRHDSVKFVVGSDEDLHRALEIIEECRLKNRCHIFFSPVYGKIAPAHIVDFMIDHQLTEVKIQLQLHKYIWEPDKRGV